MTPSEHGPVRAVVEAAIVAQSDVGKVISGTETYITNERKLAAIRAQADALDAARLTWPISDEAVAQLADAWMVEPIVLTDAQLEAGAQARFKQEMIELELDKDWSWNMLPADVRRQRIQLECLLTGSKMEAQGE